MGIYGGEKSSLGGPRQAVWVNGGDRSNRDNSCCKGSRQQAPRSTPPEDRERRPTEFVVAGDDGCNQKAGQGEKNRHADPTTWEHLGPSVINDDGSNCATSEPVEGCNVLVFTHFLQCG